MRYGVPFNEFPRFPIQLADYGLRMAAFAGRLARAAWRRDLSSA